MLPDNEKIKGFAAAAAADRANRIESLKKEKAPQRLIDEAAKKRSIYEETVSFAALEEAKRILQSPGWEPSANPQASHVAASRFLKMDYVPDADVFWALKHVVASVAPDVGENGNGAPISWAESAGRCTVQCNGEVLAVIQAELQGRTRG